MFSGSVFRKAPPGARYIRFMRVAQPARQGVSMDQSRRTRPQGGHDNRKGRRMAVNRDADTAAKLPDEIPRFAVLSSLRGYHWGWLRADIAAGLAIASVGLPSAIAYPCLLYTSPSPRDRG